MDWAGKWIWASEPASPRNAFVRFRRNFNYIGGKADLHITADSRYTLYVNGEQVGQGPVRAWPNHWRYDTYDLTPYITTGKNTIAVLVNYYGEGNFQYILAPAGLLVNIEQENETIATDKSWSAQVDTANISATPRISVQEPFEEQFDGRNFDDWTSSDYDDSAWKPAAELRPALDGFHNNLEHRAIPFLTQEPVFPKRIVAKEIVRSLPYRFTVNLRQYVVPGDFTSNYVFWHGYLATQVWSPEEAEISFSSPHFWEPVKINGQELSERKGTLKAGWNSMVLQTGTNPHMLDYAFCIDGPEGLRFSCTGDDKGSTWAVVGPFEVSEDKRKAADNSFDECRLIAEPLHASATFTRGEEFWANADVPSVTSESFFQQVRPEHLPQDNIFIRAYTEKVVEESTSIENETAIFSGNDWTSICPSPDGDVRILVDFGDELLAFHKFEVDTSAGTIIDFHNFEFIQPDGRHNYAEGMNNSFRYICKQGRQSFQTLQHRGFRYSYIIFRNMTAPVKIKGLQAIFNSYPQTGRGSFACSDAKLDRIWKAGAQSLRCCSEDTYTDCPTYEQTHWVGDARNEALVDWVVNGDPRLWYRCLEQTGQSLERSPITESHVPSAWQNILPAWSFLWMRSCVEYLAFTGDREKSLKLLEFIEKNVKGITDRLNEQGLFYIRGWNMFDWADMDTPSVGGAVTHNNCFAVLSLHEAAEMARTLGEPELAVKWEASADMLSKAINEHLWNDEKQAYTDCIRGSEQSKIFSQQTQTAAYMSGVARGERAERCRIMMHNPPEGFVKAGSPFFEFFLLEAYTKEGREKDFLDTIRRDWGFMVDMGATTFWEMWSGRTGRLTRSHCHAWSAAPTYFLSSYVLGVTPEGPGFSPAVIEPHPGDLEWCRGTMPTPTGDIEVQWDNQPDKPFALRVKVPEGMNLKITLPRQGTATVNGVEVEAKVR